jgi:hypothetical protein
MRRSLAGAVLALTVASPLTACGDTPSPKAPAKTTEPQRTSSLAACEALLEKTYQERQLRDVSNEPECTPLSHDQYVKAVGDVLGAHKDDFLDQGAKEADWDEAWDTTAPAQQDVVCRRLREDGAIAVGKEMAEAAGSDSTGDETEMAQYFLTDKCGQP